MQKLKNGKEPSVLEKESEYMGRVNSGKKSRK